MPKLGSSMTVKVMTVGMSGTAHGMARRPRTKVRPLKDQLVTSATPRPKLSHTTTIDNVNSKVVRTEAQK